MATERPTLIQKATQHSNRLTDDRCHGITRAGSRCRHQAISNSMFCGIHARDVEPADDHSAEQGRYTGYVGVLESKYQDALQDRYLLHLRDEIAILDARLKDLLPQVKEGANAAAWKKVTAQYRLLKTAFKKEDMGSVHALLDTLDEAMAEGKREIDLWFDIQATMEQRRKLVETEQKYLAQTNQMIPLESAIVLLSGTISAIKNSLKKYVANHEVEETIVLDAQREYERLIGA